MPSRKASFLAVDAPGDARTDARAQLIIWRLRANHWRGIASPAQALQRLWDRHPGFAARVMLVSESERGQEDKLA